MLLRRTAKDGSTETVDLAELDAKGAEMREVRGGQIALIPQEPMAAFSPVHTVGDQIIEAIRLHRNVNKREARKIAAPAVQRRRHPCAGAAAGCVLVATERRAAPTGHDRDGALLQSVDPDRGRTDHGRRRDDQAQVLRLLRRLQQERNSAIIFITHDLGVIAQMADYVTVMYLGLVMEQGPVDRIFQAVLSDRDRRLGRDQWSRLMFGTRISMTVGLIAVFLSVILGVLLGGVSGYFGGAPDMIIQRVIEILQSLPTIPIWLAMTAAMPRDWPPERVFFAITIILALIGWTTLAREVRGRFLSCAKRISCWPPSFRARAVSASSRATWSRRFPATSSQAARWPSP